MAEAPGPDEDQASRRRKRGLLKLYYGVTDQTSSGDKSDPYDINEAHFEHDVFLDKLFKEKTLAELMDKETEIVKQIRSLDSDMQTLVYENYNKFISATDTIKKMKNDFRRMEDEMSKLNTTLSTVTEYSDKINDALHEKRQHIAKLSGVHILLKKLQFLFELPSRLKKCIELRQYSLAVRYYIKARDVLYQYKHMPSFQGIHSDCETIVVELMKKLREQLRNPSSSTRELAECVDLLLKLQEPAGALCNEFLCLAKDKVDESLGILKEQVKLKEEFAEEKNEDSVKESPPDILEFMDKGCNGFLSDMTLVIASYNELFFIRQSDDPDEKHKIHDVAKEKLNSFIMDHMADYFKLVRKRLELETQTEDNMILVRGLDKFHRKIQAVHQLLPDSSIGRTGANIVAFAAHSRVTQYLNFLQDRLSGIISDMRQSLVSSRLLGTDKTHTLADIMATALANLVDQIKGVLLNLKGFINLDITFSSKPYFRGPFCVDDIREGLVIGILRTLVNKVKGFCDDSASGSPVPPSLLLILSRLTLDFSEQTIVHLITVTEEWFPVDDSIKVGSVVTLMSDICNEFKDTAQELLNAYVKLQGVTASQMIRKSVETRDWLNTIEPRTVRAVMKRLVEDISTMDTEVGHLFEEGVRKAHSSDSSKWTHSYSITRGSARGQFSVGSYGGRSNIDTSLLSNIQKLFSERIEIFTSVESSKVSVLTGIIKIALKTLLECIRLRTFSKYGLQQIQVDTHFLQLYMWRFVNDENLVHFMLDEVVNSAIHRSIDPELMEPSVIEIICDRN